MRLLALDFGSRTGWAVGNSQGVDCSGWWDIKPSRGESQGMRYIKLRCSLQLVNQAHPGLGLVVYEQAHHRGGAATEYAAGCVATVQAWCAELGIQHCSVHSATLKLHATGNGRASKADMVAAASKLLGRKVEDDNEADAVLLLDYQRART
jgi:Holliday junction resolvasome RuvABC endonuclease subunit